MGGGALVVGHVQVRRAVAGAQPLVQALGHVQPGLVLLVALGLLLQLGDGTLNGAVVGQNELRLNGVRVASGVHEVALAAGLAHDVGVAEVAHHLADGVAVADVGQELVAQALALAGTLDQACDVHELHRGGHDAGGVDHLGQLVQALVRHVYDADVGVDGGKGVVGRKAALLGQGREQRGLADVGQTHDTNGK